MAGNHAQTVMMATILTLTTSSQVSALCHWCFAVWCIMCGQLVVCMTIGQGNAS